jgi:hypothetical protein
MTHHDHRSDLLPTDEPPPMGASPRQARWSWAVAAALVLALGLAFYGIDASRNGQKTAGTPVTAAPAPAAGVAPPAPQTITGQAAPPAAVETTGQAGAGSPRAR